MAAALYYKDADGTYKPIPLVDAGSLNVNTLTSVDRASVHPAGTPFAVPQHVVASDLIKVYLNGLLCLQGEHYVEQSATAITFTSDIPADMPITVTVTTVS